MSVEGVKAMVQGSELLLEVADYWLGRRGRWVAAAFHAVPQDLVAPGVEGRAQIMGIGHRQLPMGPCAAFAATGSQDQVVAADALDAG